MEGKVLLGHGSGGKLSHQLVEELFVKHFYNSKLAKLDDQAQLGSLKGRLAFSTDSFVVNPLFFPGGNIGKLAVCGTVNDVAMAGAEPKYLSAGFIIEEGFPLSKLEEIVMTMAETAKEAGVQIVTGDTKVVEKGLADGLYINTSGIGVIYPKIKTSGSMAQVGDKIIINGTMGDHGIVVMAERHGISFQSPVLSDCAPLNGLVKEIIEACPAVRVLRDPTRGGVATTLNEIAGQSNKGVILYEEKLPIKPEIQGVCDILGLDPLYVANEGKVLTVVPSEMAEEVLSVIRKNPLGKDAEIIGEVVDSHPGKVILKTLVGGSRVVDMLQGAQLPRIC